MSHYTTEQRIKLAEYMYKYVENPGAAWYRCIINYRISFTGDGITHTFYPTKRK